MSLTFISIRHTISHEILLYELALPVSSFVFLLIFMLVLRPSCLPTNQWLSF